MKISDFINATIDDFIRSWRINCGVLLTKKEARTKLLSHGKIYIYEPGTTTPKTTYGEIDTDMINPQPVIIDADGNTPVIYGSGEAVKVALLDKKERIIAISEDVETERAD
jgi:hypothetical protein